MMNQYPYMSPYYSPNINMNPVQQNVLPPQQILSVSGRSSVDAIKMSPNSSALIADSTKPIIYKCISDSLGTTTIEAFDVIPHKDEEQIQKDNVYEMISDLRVRIERLESHEQSDLERRWQKPNNAASQPNEANYAVDESHVQSQGNGQPNAQEQPPSV